MDSKSQTREWADQSLRYVSSVLGNSTPNLDFQLLQSIDHEKYQRVCDVGCGSGENLAFLAGRFGAQGIGIEPSAQGVELLREKHKSRRDLDFVCASIDRMPLESNSQDLVLCWSVLHWVGRDEYLQALGELLRITRKHLIVMDFVPLVSYRTPYKHRDGFYTHKMDFDPVFMASGLVKKVDEKRWWDQERCRRMIEERDLMPFLGNVVNWHARKLVIYEKNPAVLPIHGETDFSA